MHLFGRRNKEKRESKKQTKDSSSTNENVQLRHVLGVSLANAIQNSRSFDGQPIPALIRICLDYVALHGLMLEGIYRVSPPKSRLDELENAVNNGQSTQITFADAHEAAGLLKRFLRQLPDHILTQQSKQRFEDKAHECKCKDICRCQVIVDLKELLITLPVENIYLLAYVFRHAQLVIQNEIHNKMGLPAIGVLLQATLNLSRNLIRIFILNATDLFNKESDKSIIRLFDDINVKPYVKPMTINELQDHPPAMKNDLQEEIFRQQNLLAFLHEQLQETRSSDSREVPSAKEEEMWAVQQAITTLKRQLKAITTTGGQMVVNEEEQQPNASSSSKFPLSASDGQQAAGDAEEDAVNPALLEKQLWAIHTSLTEEITDEKRQVARLLTILRELNNQVPAEMLTSQRQTCGNNNVNRQNSVKSTPPGSTRTTSDDSSEEAANKLEEQRDALLNELVHYRNICAQLRAQLEHKTILLKNLKCNNNNNNCLPVQVHPSEPPPPEPVSTTNLVATVAASEGRRQPQVADASNTTGTGEQQNKQASLLATRF